MVLCGAVVYYHTIPPVVFTDDDGHLTYKPVARYQLDEMRLRTFSDYVLTRMLSNTVGYQCSALLKPFVAKGVLNWHSSRASRLRNSENSYRQRDFFIMKDIRAFEDPTQRSSSICLIARAQWTSITDDNMLESATWGYAAIYSNVAIVDGFVQLYIVETLTSLDNPWGLYLYNLAYPNNSVGAEIWESAKPIHEFNFRGYGRIPKKQSDTILRPMQDTVSTNPTSSWQ